MIGRYDIRIQASNPNIPLQPIFSYRNSPSSFRIVNVPEKIGNWKITEVLMTVNYPDNSIVTNLAKKVSDSWVVTIQGRDTVGKSYSGFTISANGYDENEQPVTGYVLGKGDVIILDDDGSYQISPTYYLHLLSAMPATPKVGDFTKDGSTWKLYTLSGWSAISNPVSTSQWGNITGNLSAQTDLYSTLTSLNNGLATKANTTYVDQSLSAKRDMTNLSYARQEATNIWTPNHSWDDAIQPTEGAEMFAEPFWSPFVECWQCWKLNYTDGEWQGTGEKFSMLEDYENPNAVNLLYPDSVPTSRIAIVQDQLALMSNLSAISILIPQQATSSNKLADKAFVNSSITTNTAYFRGTYNSVGELPTTGMTNNDYAFVIRTDAVGQTFYDRYKYSSATSSWAFEYSINNSGFTAAQYAAINSGIVASDVAQIETNRQAILNKVNTTDVYLKSELSTFVLSGQYEDQTTFSFDVLYKV